MFVLTLTYKAPIEEVLRLLPAHNQYLSKYYEAGNFMASGPQIPRAGGVILCKADNRAAVEQIIKEDPFNEIAVYHIVEFEVNKNMPGFEALLK